MRMKNKIKCQKFVDTLITQIVHHDKICLFVHESPDFDALGSAYGLKRIIAANFNNKEVHVYGIKQAIAHHDMEIDFFPIHEDVDFDKETFCNGALGISVDVPTIPRMLDNEYFLKCDVNVQIDHHLLSVEQFSTERYIEQECAATCQIITKIAYLGNLSVTSEAATYLFAGLITDTNRFYFETVTEETYFFATYLYEHGAKRQDVLNFVYDRTKQDIEYQTFLFQHVKFENGLVSLYVPDNSAEQFGINPFKNYVGLIVGIRNYPIALYARYDKDHDCIRCSVRSKKMPIFEIAKKHHGGGHELASGCFVKDQAELAELRQELIDAYAQFRLAEKI